MATSVLITRPYGLVLTESSVPCIITQCRAFSSATEFITLHQSALVHFEANSTPERPWGWVSDVHRLEAIPVQAQDWLLAEFTPRAAAAGLRELSLVQPASQSGFHTTHSYSHGVSPGGVPYILRTAHYHSLDTALVGARMALAQSIATPQYH